MVMSVRQTDNDSFWVNLWKIIRARFCKKKIKISINAGYLLFYLFDKKAKNAIQNTKD
jgi:hypothetical protein